MTDPAPALPAAISTFAEFTVQFTHGPDGYKACAIGNMRMVFARTGWHPSIADALSALSAAMTPALTRSARRDAPARDDR